MDALHLVVDANEHAALPDAVQELYKLTADGTFALDVDADGDKLMSALKSERAARKELQRENTAAAVAAVADIAAAHAARDRATAEARAAKALLLDAKVAAGCAAVGMHGFAAPDAINRAREVFDIGSNGDVIAKDGKLTLAAWLADSRTFAPHWHPATASGTGAGHGRSDHGTTRTLTRAAFDRLSPQQRGAQLASGAVVVD